MASREANLALVKEAEEKQNATKESVFRIQRQLQETESMGAQTLEELRKQTDTMDGISRDLDSVDAKLDETAKLQTKFDWWAFNWLGGKKKKAIAEAQAEISANKAADLLKVKEVFEHEKYDTMSRAWKPAGLVLCNNPTASAPEGLFNPAEQTAESSWVIDYSFAGIDAEGWTYSADFATLNKTGAGKPVPEWNHYARRRKWRFHEQKGANMSAITEVKERSQARKDKIRPVVTQAEKIGYVPRSQMARMTASGLTSNAMNKKGFREELDEDSAAGLETLKSNDREIDQNLDAVSATLDKITDISKAMREEVTSQNKKIDTITNKMENVAEKQTIVTMRSKYQLK